MDIFTDVLDSSYLKGTIFYFPRAHDNVKAVAVDRQTGQYLIAIYSVLFTLIAIEAWQLATTLVMMLHSVPEPTITHDPNNNDVSSRRHASTSDLPNPSGDSSLIDPPESSCSDPRGGPNPDSQDILESQRNCKDTKRVGMAMAGFWNAREPLHAVFFTTKYLTKAGLHSSKRVIYFIFGLFLLSVIGVAATYVSSIFVAGKLVLGTAAPARMSEVFIPSMPTQMTNYDLLRFQALGAPAALRALGSAEAASVTVRKKVKFDKLPFGSTDSTENQPAGITYEYSVTGADMGLQKYSELRQEVTGECVTAYDWYAEQQDDFDVYRPWGLRNTTIQVPRTGEADSAPRVQALAFPYDLKSDPREFLPANNSFGIFVFSAGRKSYRGSSDVWYFTQQNERSNTSSTDTPPWVVSPKRPALSCWQQDTWVYKGKTYKNIYDLSEPSVIDFPKAWFTLLQLEFSLPRIVGVINAAGPSALMSSMTHTGRSFDAESSSLEKDMLRLLVASRISSVHTFRDSIMVTEEQNFDNAAKGTDGDPEKGVADFVVTTPQVLALRSSILVAVPSTLLGLMMLLVTVKLVKRGTLRQKLAWYEAPYLYARGEPLHQPFDLYRTVCGDIRSDSKPNDWGAVLHDPFITPGKR